MKVIDGSALFSVELGLAKFARLKMLKNSERNSKFLFSLIGNRLARMRSNCWKFGPLKAFRGKFPYVPGSGIAKAAGFRKLRSLPK